MNLSLSLSLSQDLNPYTLVYSHQVDAVFLPGTSMKCEIPSPPQMLSSVQYLACVQRMSSGGPASP